MQSPAPPTLKTAYRAHKSEILQAITASGRPLRQVRSVLHRLTRLADSTLKTLWRQAGLDDSTLCLVAVGGFGRGELFPHSDIDVLVLLPNDVSLQQDPALQTRIEGFISRCWDSGLEIGSSVRTLDECLAESARDVTVKTSLLEGRRVCGEAGLYETFTRQYQAELDAAGFFRTKILEMQQRHSKFQNTPYALEPNCKESPGGLRDLQIILWVARAAGYGSSWLELTRNGLATAFEARQLKRNETLLSLIRCRLHLIAGRREDRLVFDLQNAVAEAFGYSSSTSQGKPGMRASELLMREYYWAAKAVSQLNQILLLNIEERLNPSRQQALPINPRFSDKAGLIEVASDDLYQREPHAIMETFLVYQTTEGAKGLSARTLRALYNARNLMDGKFRQDPANRQTFMRILQQRHGVTHALRLMNQTSVLGRYLWVFRRIVGQMQHDLFHVYTVDQHILMVLRNLRHFFIAEYEHEYPFCSELASGWDKPWLLYAAALYHDIAKGRGGDHSELGALEVRRFCQQHGVEDNDAKLLEFLVREHLTMSRIAQKSDLSDPDVIQAFARHVGDERHLTALYLLTVADVRGTSPKVWNAWKGKLLEDLYRLTLRTLGGQAAAPAAEVEARKREALVILALYSLPHQGHKKLWDTLDVGYFMRHEAEDIAWHTRQLARHVGTGQTIVRARRSPLGEGLEVLVYTPDQPDLFARICAYFDQSDFSIQDARVHTARNGYALDTFQVVTAALPEHYQELTSMVEVELSRTIAELRPLPEPSRGRLSRRVRSFPVTPRVSLSPDEKAQRWLLSISASDQPGLLYKVARVLAQHKLNLQLAKINTLGERVDDVFLVDGPALQNNREQIAIETELLDVLTP
ncbi:MAG: [protein-PII] uridylyltransferase [Hylemonella sp.]